MPDLGISTENSGMRQNTTGKTVVQDGVTSWKNRVLQFSVPIERTFVDGGTGTGLTNFDTDDDAFEDAQEICAARDHREHFFYTSH